jgi:hypothetical protein
MLTLRGRPHTVRVQVAQASGADLPGGSCGRPNRGPQAASPRSCPAGPPASCGAEHNTVDCVRASLCMLIVAEAKGTVRLSWGLDGNTSSPYKPTTQPACLRAAARCGVNLFMAIKAQGIRGCHV